MKKTRRNLTFSFTETVIWYSVYDAVWDSTKNHTCASVREHVRHSLHQIVDESCGASLGDSVAAYILSRSTTK